MSVKLTSVFSSRTHLCPNLSHKAFFLLGFEELWGDEGTELFGEVIGSVRDDVWITLVQGFKRMVKIKAWGLH